MKGIVFTLLQDAVRREFGEDTWDRLLQAAGLEGAYTSLGSYADDEMARLVEAAASALRLPGDEVLRWFGRQALPMLAAKYPALFEKHRRTRNFLLTLNEIIHPEVRKLYPGADVPVFDYDTSSEEVLVMAYRSRRKLCAFAAGLIEGAAAHFGEKVSLEHPECMNRGGERCIFRLSFAPRGI